MNIHEEIDAMWNVVETVTTKVASTSLHRQRERLIGSARRRLAHIAKLARHRLDEFGNQDRILKLHKELDACVKHCSDRINDLESHHLK